MAKCMLCGAETQDKVCPKCIRDYGLKKYDSSREEQERLDAKYNLHETSVVEYLLHTLVAIAFIGGVVLLSYQEYFDYYTLAQLVISCIFIEGFAQVVKWLRLAVNELIEIKSKMK